MSFGPHQRELVREYYVEHHGKEHCPPGLAKKHTAASRRDRRRSVTSSVAGLTQRS